MDGPSNLELRSFEYKETAVAVRHACKNYGGKKNPIVVLDDLNMTVPKGAIYGLLGASGCGKTTLLNSITGRGKLDSGEIWVLGGYPGTKSSGVPGPNIGYMPQNISLYNEFSIKETMTYFGWIAGMPSKQVKERLDFLERLLMLPDVEKKIKHLSGGQQRRVSFATALLHEPELLILDEPTVGLDPVLRETIWDHLINITKEGRTTVILTTHYIDETRQAHLIGLIRGGYVIAEETPQNLLTKFNASTLEDAFLKLSVLQNRTRRRRSSIAQDVVNAITIPAAYENPSVDDLDPDQPNEISAEFGDTISLSNRSSKRRFSIAVPDLPPPMPSSGGSGDHRGKSVRAGSIMKALLWKNYLWMLKNLPLMISIIAIPCITVFLFCIAVGHNPTYLDVAVVNYETDNKGCNEKVACNSSSLSCVYLEYLQDKTLNLIYYDSEELAVDSVLHGKTFASIVIRDNYTSALRNRIELNGKIKEREFIDSTIDVFRDVSVKDVAAYVKLYLYESFLMFVGDYLESCGDNREGINIPIHWNEPIYGVRNPELTDFAFPGVLLTLVFFSASALTGISMLVERSEGILERSLVMGVTNTEILAAHIVSEFGVMLGQAVTTLLIPFSVFHLVNKGSMVLLLIMNIFTGFCGMCFGYALSSAVRNESTATFVLLGSFIPGIILSGVIWPIQAMYYALQLLSPLIPFTYATEGMRSILQRGWGISEPSVYYGFLSMSLWSIIFLLIAILVLRYKKD